MGFIFLDTHHSNEFISIDTNIMAIVTDFKMNPPAECELPYLSRAAAKIAYQNFEWHFATFVIFNSSLICGVNAFIKTYGNSLIIGNTTLEIPDNMRQCVLFVMDIKDLYSILELMKASEIDNTGKYIIICQNKKEHCDENDAMEVLWTFRIINVVYLNSNVNSIEGYTYYYDKNCKNSAPDNVFTWAYNESRHKQHSELFPVKFKNMYGCSLIVSTFDQKPYMEIGDNINGADGELLLILIKALNASLEIMTPRIGVGWGYRDENETWVGSLGDIFNEWANFSMTSASLTLSRITSFEISAGYYRVNIVWVSHPSQVESASKKLLRPLQMKARIALFISFVLTLFFIVALRTNLCSLRAKIHLGQIPDSMLFHCCEMCMGQPVTKLPMKMAFLCLVLFWIWYCYLIRTFYQVYLIDSLKNDVYSAALKKIDEYINEEYPFGGGAALKDYYDDYPPVFDGWTNIESNEIYNILHDLANGKKFVLAMNLATAEIFQRETKENVFILPEKIATSHSVIFFKKYSPLIEAIDDILIRLVEAGLPDKIYRNNALPQYKNPPSNDPRPIKLQHFTGCYIIIVIGWILSCMVFVVELCKAKKRKFNVN